MKTTLALIATIAMLSFATAPAQAGMSGFKAAQANVETTTGMVHTVGGRRHRGLVAGLIIGASVAALASGHAHGHRYHDRYEYRHERRCRRWYRQCDRGSDRSCWKFERRC